MILPAHAAPPRTWAAALTISRSRRSSERRHHSPTGAPWSAAGPPPPQYILPSPRTDPGQGQQEGHGSAPAGGSLAPGSSRPPAGRPPSRRSGLPVLTPEQFRSLYLVYWHSLAVVRPKRPRRSRSGRHRPTASPARNPRAIHRSERNDRRQPPLVNLSRASSLISSHVIGPALHGRRRQGAAAAECGRPWARSRSEVGQRGLACDRPGVRKVEVGGSVSDGAAPGRLVPVVDGAVRSQDR